MDIKGGDAEVDEEDAKAAVEKERGTFAAAAAEPAMVSSDTNVGEESVLGPDRGVLGCAPSMDAWLNMF